MVLIYSVMQTFDEYLAADSGMAHVVYRTMPSGGAFLLQQPQLENLTWLPAEKIDVHFKGHKGDKVQVVIVHMRTRNEVRGSRSAVRSDGCSVACVVELVSCLSGLHVHALPILVSCGKSEPAMGYVCFFHE